MNPFELEPMDRDVSDLLDTTRSAWGSEEAPLASKLRVGERLELSVAGQTPQLPKPHGAWRLSQGLVAAGSLTVVAGVGVAITAALRLFSPHVATHPVTSAIVVDVLPTASVPLPIEVRPSAVTHPPARAMLPRATPATRPSVAPSAPSASSDADNTAEQLLLDEARGALRGHDAAAALAPLFEHAKRFAHGRLTEEREALLVLALSRSGRAAEAREHASRFVRQYPNSLFMTAVQDAVELISDK